MSASPFRQLLGYSVAYRQRMVWASVCSVLNKLFDLAPPALIGLAVDVVVKREDSWLGVRGLEDPSHQLILVAVLTVIIWGLESIFEYLFQWLWRNIAQSMQHELRCDAYAHVQGLDMTWHQEASTGRVMSILNDDINQLERFLDGGANDIIQVSTTVITVSAVFFWISPGVAGLALLPIPLILWGSFRFQKTIAPRYAAVREDASQVNSQLSNNLSGIATIKAFTSEAFEVARVQRLSETFRVSNRKAIALSSAFSPLIRMAIVIGFTATLIYGGWLTLAGAMEVGTYSVLVFLTQRLLWPLTRLGATFDLYQRAMASTRRVLGLLAEESVLEDGPAELTEANVRGDITFHGVDFAYPGRAPLFEGFTWRVPAGNTVAVVGPTGSGKSSVVRLLLRFYDPQAGTVSIDGIALPTLTRASIRDAIGLVAQSTDLFPGTVLENIQYGARGCSRDVAIQAAVDAEADEFIRALPKGYDTRIGERGQRLSGGQRQRLCIARALVKDPPILVLDEATSAVDNETEAAIQRSLERIAVGRTVIVIAHRLSTIRHADEIIVLDEGKIVASGPHDALVENSPLYARLWNVQTGAKDTALLGKS